MKEDIKETRWNELMESILKIEREMPENPDKINSVNMLVIKNTDKIKNRRIAGGEYRIVDMNRIYLIDKETGIGKQWYGIRVIKNRTGISQFVQLNREEGNEGVYELKVGEVSKFILKKDIERMDSLIKWIEYLMIETKTI